MNPHSTPPSAQADEPAPSPPEAAGAGAANGPSAWSAAPPYAYPGPHLRTRGGRSMEETIRMTLLVLMLGVLVLAVLLGLVSILNIVELWFEYQYVPIAKAVLAIVVAGLAVYVLRLLVRRPHLGE